MNPIALEQTKDGLRRAERAMAALEAADSYQAAEDAWTDFLLPASSICSKLEQGTKAPSPSQGWFGRKKKERRDDPLLRYLHFAWNSDEHGVERVVSRYKNTSPIWGPATEVRQTDSCYDPKLRPDHKTVVWGEGGGLILRRHN